MVRQKQIYIFHKNKKFVWGNQGETFKTNNTIPNVKHAGGNIKTGLRIYKSNTKLINSN